MLMMKKKKKREEVSEIGDKGELENYLLTVHVLFFHSESSSFSSLQN